MFSVLCNCCLNHWNNVPWKDSKCHGRGSVVRTDVGQEDWHHQRKNIAIDEAISESGRRLGSSTEQEAEVSSQTPAVLVLMGYGLCPSTSLRFQIPQSKAQFIQVCTRISRLQIEHRPCGDAIQDAGIVEENRNGLRVPDWGQTGWLPSGGEDLRVLEVNSQCALGDTQTRCYGSERQDKVP